MTKITALQSLRLKTSCRLWEESFKVSLTRWNMTLKDLGNSRLGSRFKLNWCSHKFGLLTSLNNRNWANGSGILLLKMSRQLGYPTKSLRPRGLSSSDTRTRMRCATSRSRFQTESRESTLWNSTTSQEKIDTSSTKQATRAFLERWKELLLLINELKFFNLKVQHIIISIFCNYFKRFYLIMII